MVFPVPLVDLARVILVYTALFQAIPRTVALAGGGFCFLRLPLRRVKSRLPLLGNVLQLGKVLAVCLLRRHAAVFASKQTPDLVEKLLQAVQ